MPLFLVKHRHSKGHFDIKNIRLPVKKALNHFEGFLEFEKFLQFDMTTIRWLSNVIEILRFVNDVTINLFTFSRISISRFIDLCNMYVFLHNLETWLFKYLYRYVNLTF